MKPETLTLLIMVSLGAVSALGFIVGRLYELNHYIKKINDKRNNHPFGHCDHRTTYTVSNVDLQMEDVRN